MKHILMTLFLLFTLTLTAATEPIKKQQLDIQKSEKDLIVFITPHPDFIAYTVFIHTKTEVIKRELRSRKSVFRAVATDVIDAQIVGEGVHGPQVLFYRNFLKKRNYMVWKKDFITSINALRLKYKVRPLTIDKRLEPAAYNALSRTQKGNLYHYTAKKGSIRHTQIKKGKLGENLYSAQSLPEAWKMLQNSPSHLYNMLNPQYISFFQKENIIKGFHVGVLIFSSE